MEDKRASAGNVTVTSSNPTNFQPTQQNPQVDPIASLQKLKMLLDYGLVKQEKFDIKKSEILSRL